MKISEYPTPLGLKRSGSSLFFIYLNSVSILKGCIKLLCSRVHNHQKLKQYISLEAKVTCLSESVFIPSSYSEIIVIFMVTWVSLAERPIT